VLPALAILSVSGQIRDAGATIEVESGLLDILVDLQKFLQVIENLIGNAVKFSGSAKGGPVIRIGVRRSNGESICYIKDNGVGIDSRYLDKVFELFEMLDPQTGGTGIGLAIVKRIVEANGGKVWAESDGLGHGTTFCLTLPEVKN
jgi:signal transduction histidine kinase